MSFHGHTRVAEIPVEDAEALQCILDGRHALPDAGDELFFLSVSYENGIAARLRIANRERPMVDAALLENGHCVQALELRETLMGQYDFIYENRHYRLDLVSNLDLESPV